MTDTTNDHQHEHSEVEHTPHPLFRPNYEFDFLFPDELELQPLLEEVASSLGATVSKAGSLTVFTYQGRDFTVERIEDESSEAALGQSWNWRGARAVVPECRYTLRISDNVSEGDDWRERIRTFRPLLGAISHALQPVAVHSVPSQQYLEPRGFSEAMRETPGDELFGFVNVRLYKVDGHERGVYADYDETVMDTLGLTALGLPDLQAHFKHLDPSLVAELLYNTATYIFDQGPVIESGHQLAGFAHDHKWRCQLEESIVEPLRLVVDLDPGKPYAAGDRTIS